MDKEEKQRIADMSEGYQAMAEENKRFAEMAANITREGMPEWE
jgi:hypothetical protein